MNVSDARVRLFRIRRHRPGPVRRAWPRLGLVIVTVAGMLAPTSEVAAAGWNWNAFRRRGDSACTPLESESCVRGNSNGTVFREEFNGSPSAPSSAMNRLDRWYAQPTLDEPEMSGFRPAPMQAEHGPNCSPAPDTHPSDTFEGTIFLCRDHIMTAMNAGGGEAGVVGLKPNHMVDLTKGEAVIRFDISTLSPSGGDWWEIWITPWEDQLVAPEDHWLHMAGPPKNGLYFVVRDLRDQKTWAHTYFRNYKSAIPGAVSDGSDTGVSFWNFPDISQHVSQSSTRRDTYEIRLTKNRVRTFVESSVDGTMKLVSDFEIPGGFDGDAGVVQFMESSYGADQDGKFGCEPYVTCRNTPSATWHWDNVEIFPARPYSIVAVDPYLVRYESAAKSLAFRQPAPASSRLLFTGWARDNRFEISFDSGSTWRTVSRVREHSPTPGSCGPSVDDCPPFNLTYSVDVPAGATGAVLRASPWCVEGCFNDLPRTWWAMNFHVVSQVVPAVSVEGATVTAETTPASESEGKTGDRSIGCTVG